MVSGSGVRGPGSAVRAPDAIRVHLRSSAASPDVMSQLFRRKPISELLPEGAHALKRVLGAGDLIMLAIGAVIGAAGHNAAMRVLADLNLPH